MEKTFLAITRLLKIDDKYYTFHFNGVYFGSKINCIRVIKDQETKLKLDEEYLLHLTLNRVFKKVIYSTIVSAKCLDDVKGDI